MTEIDVSSGVSVDIPRIPIHVRISNGALKIVRAALNDVMRWAHDNPWLAALVLLLLIFALYACTQRIKATVTMKRDVLKARDEGKRQLHLDFRATRKRNEEGSESEK